MPNRIRHRQEAAVPTAIPALLHTATGAIGRMAAALCVLLFGYALAGAIGGSIPASGTKPPASTPTVTIWVESNGIHTAIIVPKQAAGVDWRPLFPARDLADPRYGGHDHLAIGWGEAAFFLETPRWRDIRPATIAAAAIGSDRSLIHVDHLPRPRPGDGARPIRLREADYRRLADYITASLAAAGQVHPGYGAYDAFYTARGRYSALTTCNAWTGAALRHAGVRMGRWTPFPTTVMWWL
ncbi:TIGR02117 family protein [uncultured Sphingomonas sp.]|uniref:TIGR02117 family protein n=1 Tax=uncultured Sphingomonas sp. TaxID=158754 RepID=UPI00260A2FD8|nr:TIGR02117 family protein [uncultured Sphingomonas sp.]